MKGLDSVTTSAVRRPPAVVAPTTAVSDMYENYGDVGSGADSGGSSACVALDAATAIGDINDRFPLNSSGRAAAFLRPSPVDLLRALPSTGAETTMTLTLSPSCRACDAERRWRTRVTATEAVPCGDAASPGVCTCWADESPVQAAVKRPCAATTPFLVAPPPPPPRRSRTLPSSGRTQRLVAPERATLDRSYGPSSVQLSVLDDQPSPTLFTNCCRLDCFPRFCVRSKQTKLARPPVDDLTVLPTVCRCNALETGTGNDREDRVIADLHRCCRRRRLVYGLIGCSVGLPVLCLSLLGLFLLISQQSTEEDPSWNVAEGMTELRGQNIISSRAAADTVAVRSSLQRATIDESGWAVFGNASGGNGSRYIVINTAMTFHAGQERCHLLGGHLAHVNTLREQLFLEDFLRQTIDSAKQHGDRGSWDGGAGGVGFWLGAKRPRGSHHGTCLYDQWRWIDFYGRVVGTVSGLTAFVPGKPDNHYDPEECLYMTTREDSADETRYLKWDDAPCDLNSIGGIKALCEVQLNG